MRDVEKLCQCGKKHKWGIVGHSQDNVKLYGAHPEEGCPEFREDTEEARALATLTPKQVAEIWSATPFLNPQVPVATRIAVAQIVELGKGEADLVKLGKQWPEFMGLAISQLSDIRGAMVRDDNKFAHLVAHTDEIVEAMRDVVGLKEQLARMNMALDAIGQRAFPERRPWAIVRFFNYISSHLRGEAILTDVVNADDD